MSASLVASRLAWPLMENNITPEDRQALIRFLNQENRLTQAKNVEAFEREWSEWLGVRYSVFVNSGSSANLITLAALRETAGLGEIIVPTLTWVSDIAAVLHLGFKPVFVDIHPRTLGMDDAQVIRKITDQTKAVFLTHVLGYNALTDRLLDTLKSRGIPLIEDACESHGTTFHGRKVGCFGLMSNFSFYYAHHLTTIEGGMACTNDERIYQALRMFRSHGLVRESTSETSKSSYAKSSPDLDPEFIFAYPAYNLRSTEIGAVLGRNQLKRLDQAIAKRNRNLKLFLAELDTCKYMTDFEVEGSSNYALTLVLRESATHLATKVIEVLKEAGVEYRRGMSGGGNQLRQPYLRKLFAEEYKNYPRVEHVHFYGFYIGNYPDLPAEKIKKLCRLLNTVE